MGNYNGQVRCSYCYEYGHNKRTCPERLARLQKNLENEKSDSSQGRYTEYYANQIAKMTGVNPETGEKRGRRNESWGRKCSYCGERGHNRRTCETLKSDLARYAVMTRETRQEVRDWALTDGIGIGAMVKYKAYGYSTETTLMMVEAISLQCTHARQAYYQATLRPLSGVGRKQTVSIQSPDVRQENNSSSYSSTLEVAGKLTPEQMAAQIDEEWVYADIDWKNPPDTLNNNIFEKGEGRDFHFWNNID